MTRRCPHCQQVSPGWIYTGEGEAEVYWCPKCHKMSLPKDCPVVQQDDDGIMGFLRGMGARK